MRQHLRKVNYVSVVIIVCQIFSNFDNVFFSCAYFLLDKNG